ncbi:MAG: class A beta-lactamase-related serine hydrolase [Nitrospirae bacterium]|nr:MAG: class A beta-lactamase-related serine hydrolase [Nitrospirota bacterium]
MSDPIAQKMQQGVEEGVFPGAVLLVEHKGRRVHHAAYGFTCLLPDRAPTTPDTIYDLASLTKPLATAAAAAFLVADGKLGLDDPLERYVPELTQDDLRWATIRHLLNHTSGLPAWRPLYERIVPDGRKLREQPLSSRRAAIYDAIHREPLVEPVGGRCVYSDLGFILLGEILERIVKQEWAAFIHVVVWGRLGAQGLFYMSEGGPTSGMLVGARQFAATEQDDWRGRMIRGEVHDENTAVMGGISAHAGLFGTADAAARAVKPWLAAVRGDASPIPMSWAKEFVRRQGIDPHGSWALGWDTPSKGPDGQPSSSGAHFSPGSFGHLGYAGTSVWIDPERDLIVVLLTNRVHPTRKNDQIRAFRPAIHDVIFKSVVRN